MQTHPSRTKASLVRATLFISVLFLVSTSPSGSVPAGTGGAAATRIVEGVLEYIPPPEAYICFCGSFFVKTDGDEVVYLAASGIDLVPHVDKKVTVTGTAFVTGCSGTLYLPCDFLSVTSIELSTPTATERMTWGAIKSLFE